MTMTTFDTEKTVQEAAMSLAKQDGGGKQQVEEDRLSSDLAQFLSNPSLQAALADGSLDLASYSSTVEQELHELESQCINVYRNKSNEISNLREELEACDAVLGALQEMLLGFQADLGGLSGDIRALQDKSRSLGIQLRNRRRAEQGLREFLQHIVIAPHLAQTICRGPVNEQFQTYVYELDRIDKDVHDQTPQEWSCCSPPAQTVSGHEMQDHVRKLRLVAVGRTRDYFLAQMALLRQPQTNVRMIQKHGLVKYANLQDFLEDNSPDIATEMYNVYVESMSKTLYALFRTYQAQLDHLDSTRATSTRQDVIAIDDASLRDVVTTKAKKRIDSFTLGRRASDVLDSATARPILAHVAMSEGKKYPYEMLFRSIMLHLMDAVTNEHIFCRQFFKRDAFSPLFHSTLGLLLEQLENYLFGCHDAISLLLMIKITHAHRRILHSRRIHSLDGFLDQVNKLIWPRLKVVMDAHLRSIKSANAKKLGGVELHAHYVSRRYAEFTCSILMVLHRSDKVEPAAAAKTAIADAASASAKVVAKANTSLARDSAGDMLLNDLAVIQEETIVLLERMGDEHPSNKRRIVFLINNLDQIVCIFQERRVVGKEFNRFAEALMTQRELFVEEELLQSFSKLIAFVQQTEQHMATGGNHKEVNAQVVEALVREFATSWKIGIEQINRNVLSYFSNFRNGMEILKQVLTQLLLYYTRFQDIIRKIWRNKPPAFCKDLVGTSVILAEIKKYALSI
jgi:vacuolar protein sorting-associated protein 52